MSNTLFRFSYTSSGRFSHFTWAHRPQMSHCTALFSAIRGSLQCGQFSPGSLFIMMSLAPGDIPATALAHFGA